MDKLNAFEEKAAAATEILKEMGEMIRESKDLYKYVFDNCYGLLEDGEEDTYYMAYQYVFNEREYDLYVREREVQSVV